MCLRHRPEKEVSQGSSSYKIDFAISFAFGESQSTYPLAIHTRVHHVWSTRIWSPRPLGLFLQWGHGMHVRVKGLRVAHVEHARFRATGERVRHAPRQADVGLPAQRRGGAVGRDIGEVAFQPY